MFEWTVTYLINLLFCLWIVKWGGSGWLEGSIVSFRGLDADSIEWFVWFWIVISTLLFLGGIFDADIRSMLVGN